MSIKPPLPYLKKIEFKLKKYEKKVFSTTFFGEFSKLHAFQNAVAKLNSVHAKFLNTVANCSYGIIESDQLFYSNFKASILQLVEVGL